MLTILGVLATAFVLFLIISGFNTYTKKQTNYEFFTMSNTIAMTTGYGAILLGWGYNNGANVDLLNGRIIMGIGAIIVFMVIKNNFKQVSKKYAILGSIMQLVFYVPISVGAIFLVAGAFMFFSQTKPVYSINGRD